VWRLNSRFADIEAKGENLISGTELGCDEVPCHRLFGRSWLNACRQRRTFRMDDCTGRKSTIIDYVVCAVLFAFTASLLHRKEQA
jgi:hypothetical protein